METQNSNLGLNLPSNPPASGTTPFNQYSPYLPQPKPTQVAEPTAWEQCVEFLNSKKIIEIAIWLILLILFVPSSMAVASWNAVPGDMTYSWKISLEKGLLLVLKPSKTLQTSTQVALTKRRFTEAEKMLKGDQGELGLKNLTSQVLTTSDSIQGLSGSSKTQFSMQYIEALTELNQKLEQEKKLHQGASYKPSAPLAQKPAAGKTTGTNQPVVQYGGNQGGTTIIQNTYVQNTIVQNAPAPGGSTSIPPTITQPTASDDAVTTEIIQTQQQIQETIEQLQQQSEPEPIPEPTTPPVEPTAAPAPTDPPQQQEEPKEERKNEEKKPDNHPSFDGGESPNNSGSNSEGSEGSEN